MRKAVVCLVIVLAVLGFLAFVIYKIDKTFTLAMYSPRIVPSEKPAYIDIEADIMIDGQVIKTWIIGDAEVANTAIIFAPGYQGSRAFLAPLGEFFSRNGFLSVIFDPRGEGESDGEIYALGAFEDEDMEAVMNWIERNYDIHQFVLFGFSAGATASIIAASRNQDRVIAVIADSPFANLLLAQGNSWINKTWAWLCNLWGRLRKGIDLYRETNALAVANQVSGIFIIHGKKDRTIDFSNAQMLYDTAHDPKELWLVEGVDHVQAVKFHREEYLIRTLRFVYTTLRQRGRL